MPPSTFDVNWLHLQPKCVTKHDNKLRFTIVILYNLCVQAWLDDHGRKFGLFINNKWVTPDGRKTYETKCPSTGCLLACTEMNMQENVELKSDKN